MNTIVRIITMTTGDTASSTDKYNRTRTKSGVKRQIKVIINNGFLDENRLDDAGKKERLQLQKNLHIYKKRLEVAIEKDKPKVIANNQKKIDEIQAKLDEPFIKSNKKEVLSFTLSLVNENTKITKSKNFQDIFDANVKKFMQDEFGDLHTVSLATHYDQNSPHAHAILQVPHGESWKNFLKEKYQVDDTREAYSIINHKFHDVINQHLPDNAKLDDLQPRDERLAYMSIGKLKALTAKGVKVWVGKQGIGQNEPEEEITAESTPKAEKELKSHSQQDKTDGLESRLSDEFSESTEEYIQSLAKLSTEELWELHQATMNEDSEPLAAQSSTESTDSPETRLSDSDKSTKSRVRRNKG